MNEKANLESTLKIRNYEIEKLKENIVDANSMLKKCKDDLAWQNKINETISEKNLTIKDLMLKINELECFNKNDLNSFKIKEEEYKDKIKELQKEILKCKEENKKLYKNEFELKDLKVQLSTKNLEMKSIKGEYKKKIEHIKKKEKEKEAEWNKSCNAMKKELDTMKHDYDVATIRRNPINLEEVILNNTNRIKKQKKKI